MVTQEALEQDQSLLARWARQAYRRRWQIVIAWLVTLGALTVANLFFGGDYLSEFRVPGTQSQTARDLLAQRFPARSGDTSDLVFEAPTGVQSPDATARIQSVIDQVASIKPAVVSVDSPYQQQRLISPDGTIARATVHWSKRGSKVSGQDVNTMLKIVEGATGKGLTVEAGGNVVAQHEQPGLGSEYIGIAVAVLILLVAFGSVIAMGLPLAAAIVGLGAGFALIGLAANFGTFPAFSPQFAAMIGLGVGIDYSLLIVTRFREGLHGGRTVEESIVLATTTSGRSVIFAGVVVAIAFLGLYLMGLPFVAALGTAGAIIVIVAVLVAVTLIPSVLALTGRWIDRWRVPFLHTTEGVDESSSWFRISSAIQRHPLPYVIGAVTVLLILASPALSMRLGFTDAGNNPTSTHSRRAYDLLSKGFGAGVNGPLILSVDMSQGGRDRLDGIVSTLGSADNVAFVQPPVINQAGDTAVITVIPKTAPQDSATTDLVHTLRDRVLPPTVAGSGAKVYVGGIVAGQIDAGDRIGTRMPLLFGGVIGLSFLLLTVVFRAVVVAAKAAVVNLLSIGASYGVLVAIFQWGWGASIIGVGKGPIEVFLPMMMFTILFGLSMDYEVFLISRIREEYLLTHDNANAVSRGLTATARVITAAAAIMVAVFLSFVLGDERVIKQFGIGLATAIFVDATIVRLVLVPSTMELLGDLNWWLPAWLDRILPRINVERGREAAPVREPEAVGVGR